MEIRKPMRYKKEKKERQTKNQKDKTKFRASAKWKKFRVFMKKLCNNCDYITGVKLCRGANLHHKDLRPEHYTNISDSKRFVFLNKSIHDTVHVLYNYYKKDPSCIDRLKEVLDDMIKYSNDTVKGDNEE